MTDLTKTIIAKSDQLNADDLMGGPITVKITKVSLAAGDQPVAISYEGDQGKPWMPCKTMRRVLVNVWGNDGNAYVGRRLTLFRDDKVMYAGQAVGGVRISHMSDISSPITMSLTATSKSKKPHTVKPLVVEPSNPVPAPELVAAGIAAAMQGVDTYKAWLAGLSADDKSSIKPYHKQWSETAKGLEPSV
jgi:hypothetical protein